VQEGLFLYTHNVSPYDGGVFHQAPLLLPLFALLPDAASSPLATSLLYILLDLVGAYMLTLIADSGISTTCRLFKSPRRHLRYSSLAIAASFLFNPFTIATCLARTTSVVTNTLILVAVACATRGHSLTFLLVLGLAAYLSLYPAFLFPPLAILCFDQKVQRTPSLRPVKFAVDHVGGLLVIVGGLLGLSVSLTGSTQFLTSTYGTPLLLPDLTPNVGLWWYFFIEMFDSFREFFLGVFWLHMASYVGGITIRLRKQPLFVVTSVLGIIAIFQPYPSIADSALFLGLIPLYRHVFPRKFVPSSSRQLTASVMRYPFLETAVLMYATLLGPAFYHLWIYAGSGNANFFYAITLVWSLGLIMVVADFLYAVLRDEWEFERPEMVGKDARQI
jgi:phosphatidylinositol glycan class U